ncbi:hypothetical protein E2C01_044193 [Portunus trituberculatus]|uniref:Uncharacterized protein n=1 Tax=Portunus trituberculatus TaxID=210409 RepID=A0A5B7FYE9_PORTR|nr:hypothetical protein [Portunus trituberculatus]
MAVLVVLREMWENQEAQLLYRPGFSVSVSPVLKARRPGMREEAGQHGRMRLGNSSANGLLNNNGLRKGKDADRLQPISSSSSSSGESSTETLTYSSSRLGSKVKATDAAPPLARNGHAHPLLEFAYNNFSPT